MSKKNKVDNKKPGAKKKKYLFSLTALIILVLATLSLTLFSNGVSYQSCYNNIDKDTGYSNERWQEWSRYIQPDSEYTRIIHIKDMKKYEGEKQLMPLIIPEEFIRYIPKEFTIENIKITFENWNYNEGDKLTVVSTLIFDNEITEKSNDISIDDVTGTAVTYLDNNVIFLLGNEINEKKMSLVIENAKQNSVEEDIKAFKMMTCEIDSFLGYSKLSFTSESPSLIKGIKTDAKIIYEIEDKVILRQIIEFSNVEILEENLEKFKEYVIINNEYTIFDRYIIIESDITDRNIIDSILGL
tara:strand:+ start:262 stop:1158 length:897 start_codon:yes stop_codon:yes gene_type:complete